MQAGALAVGTAVASSVVDRAAAAVDRVADDGRGTIRTVSFDENWLFLRGAATGAQSAGFDDSGWRRLDVPHDWSIEDLPGAAGGVGGETADPSVFDYTTGIGSSGPTPGDVPGTAGPFDPAASAGGAATGYTVGGVGWYRKHFEVKDLVGPAAAGPGHRYELRLDGVYEVVDVWLNGRHLGFHPNGYIPIVLDLTSAIRGTGQNVLAVRVDNSGANSRWYAGSGIYRHTWFTVTGEVRIPTFGVFVTTPKIAAASAKVHVELPVSNHGSTARDVAAVVTILDGQGRRVVGARTSRHRIAAGASRRFALDVDVRHPKLWSTSRPHLYSARVQLVDGSQVLDTDRTSFGIRSIEWDGTHGFRLNGKKTIIRGACVHSSNGPLGAVSLGRAEQRRVELLKQAGFNAIRTAHNPPSPALLEYCDQLGMLVWDEFTDVWDRQKNPQDYHLYFPEYWRTDLSLMITRDRNHPSVVIWSMGNEIWDTTGGRRQRQLYDLIKSLDATRPVSQGATPRREPDNFSYDHVDVSDVHYDFGTPNLDALHKAHPGRAVSQSESWSTTIYDDYQLALTKPWFAGSFVWPGIDYLGETGTGAPMYGPAGTDPDTLPHFGSATYPWFQDFQGDLDLIGVRKPQNCWRSVVYGTSRLELLVERPPPDGTVQFGHMWAYFVEQPSWNWDVPDGTRLTVHAYTSADTVELYVDDTLVDTVRLSGADRMIATCTAPYSAGQLTAIAYRSGHEIARRTIVTTGAPAALRLRSDTDALTTSRDELAYVLVEVLDEQGRVVPDAVVPVHFAVSGAGTLAAVGNGNPHNVASFQGPDRYTWQGRALAILRPNAVGGRLMLEAISAGLTSARIYLPVHRIG